ncbi:hypothetical protein [Streptomyces fractus]|uniref:hypothetical protein n=1 Tax=Streptomyces fractus TaxID=641806 RepID=UPI003CEE1D64
MQHPPPATARVCSNCDGFASAAVSSGLDRDARGHLPTVTVDCPVCHGTGIRSRSVRVGSRPVELVEAAR